MAQAKQKEIDRLFKGVKEFRQTDFIYQSEVFQSLEKSQNPHTLFIGCSDSRVVPNLITKSLPGELFIVRNIANLVPYNDEESDTFVATSAVIEYAVKVLKVNNIIVCGHSNCGGCTALYYSEAKMKDLPQVNSWLELARPVIETVKHRTDINKNSQVRDWLTEQLNVVEQMNHLLTYPYVKEKFDKEELTIMGWYYVIDTGEVFNYSAEKQTFERIE